MVAAIRRSLAPLVAVLLCPACGSTSPEDKDQHILSTIPGTWEATVLGSSLQLKLEVGGVDSMTHAAPITGKGLFQDVIFPVSGNLSGNPSQTGVQGLGNVVLQWKMPYLRAPGRSFQFAGGLHEVADERMEGQLTSPGYQPPCPPVPATCNHDDKDPDVDVQAVFTKH
jgi:hypothetical protein